MKNPDKVIQGKKNRKKGAEFERKVRADLQAKGWIVSKWQNNVFENKLIPAKMGRFRTNQGGFPDFIVFRECPDIDNWNRYYEVIGVECKVGKYLDKEEKDKCKWLLDNKIFNKIHIAFKNKENKVEYKEFK